MESPTLPPLVLPTDFCCSLSLADDWMDAQGGAVNPSRPGWRLTQPRARLRGRGGKTLFTADAHATLPQSGPHLLLPTERPTDYSMRKN